MPGESAEPLQKPPEVTNLAEKGPKQEGSSVERGFQKKSQEATRTAESIDRQVDQLAKGNPGVNLTADVAQSQSLRRELGEETSAVRVKLIGAETNPPEKTSYDLLMEASIKAADATQQTDTTLRNKLLNDALDRFVRIKSEATDPAILLSADGGISGVAGKLYENSSCMETVHGAIGSVTGDLSPLGLAKAEVILKAAEAKKKTPDDESNIAYARRFIALAKENLQGSKIPQKPEQAPAPPSTSAPKGKANEAAASGNKETEEINKEMAKIVKAINLAEINGEKAKVEDGLGKLFELRVKTSKTQPDPDTELILQTAVDAVLQNVYGRDMAPNLINVAGGLINRYDGTMEGMEKAEAMLRFVRDKKPHSDFYNKYTAYMQEGISLRRRSIAHPEEKDQLYKDFKEWKERNVLRNKPEAEFEYSFMVDKELLSDIALMPEIREIGSAPDAVKELRHELTLAAQHPRERDTAEIKAKIQKELLKPHNTLEVDYLNNLGALADRLRDPAKVLLEEDRKAAYEASPEAFEKMHKQLPKVEVGGLLPWEGKNYKVEKMLGAGAGGDVYLAVSHEGEKIVIKVAKYQNDPKAEAKFMGEDYTLIRMADYQRKHNMLKEGHILTPEFLGSGNTVDGKQFLAMTFAEGKMIVGGEPLAEKDIAEIGMQACSVLKCSSELGKTYFDFHPDDLRWDSEAGKVTMLDWDVLLPLVDMDERVQRANPSIDVFTLSKYLYQGATGKDSLEVENEEINEALKTLSLSPGMKKIFAKALDEDPSQRYQAADELMADFEALGK
ncbi:MAG: hypothetical protein A2857_01785 [Candidatus Levybacteria bacterium RIFCSPHIGHO2_01_FULL_36_15]|nr:MAG: hypothetical protein A2857_01785 [Candidatus Levybacteria bacterium RIFCSPHIGHO2_01_FULL_36_15]